MRRLVVGSSNVFSLVFFFSFGQVMMMTRLGSRAKHLRSEFHGFRRVARAQAARQPPKPRPRRRRRRPGKAKLLSGCCPGEHNSTTQMNHDMDVFATGVGRGRGRARQGRAGQTGGQPQEVSAIRVLSVLGATPRRAMGRCPGRGQHSSKGIELWNRVAGERWARLRRV
jgi:hypothetical protein